MNYRKAILLHAYVIPLGGALLLAILLLVLPARFRASQEPNVQDYQSFTMIQGQAVATETKLSKSRALSAAWKTALDGEFTKSMNSILASRYEELDDKQLSAESTGGRPEGGSGLSIQGGQSATRTKLQFRGGFEPMQETLLALETRLPQMQLESLSVAEDDNGDGLRFEMTYTVWEKNSSAK